MTTTGRDRVWAAALAVAEELGEGALPELAPETVVDALEREGEDVSTRTVRRVLDAMSDLGVLEDVSNADRRLYRRRGISRNPSTDMSPGRRQPIDRYGDGAISPLSPLEADEPLIAHLWAGWGVESEPLSAYGRVVRVGLEPEPNLFSDVLRADAERPPLRDVFDLVVCHPPCQPWSTLTHLNGDPDDHPKRIDEAREVAREIGRDYIIENVPEAPLRDPVRLSGRMFGLPVVFRRAFETSFPVPQPRQTADLTDREGPFADEEGGLGSWRGSRRLWKTVKQVSGDYPAEALKNNGIPAPYIHFLARYWLRANPELIETPWSTDMSAGRSSGRPTDLSTEEVPK